MTGRMRHIAGICCGAVLALCLAAAYIGGTVSRRHLVCTGLSIKVTDSTANRFVTPADVRRYIDREYAGYMGMSLDSIDLSGIERIVDGKSAVNKSHAYTTRDGKLHVDLTQREPVVRFQKGACGFYADSRGFLFPLQNTYASHVQVIDGDIPLNIGNSFKGTPDSEEEKLWLARMISMVNFMETSKVWKDKIVQVTVGKDGSLTLVPRAGKERFIFGSPTGIEEKFSKMELYYKGIAGAPQKKDYREVDLRFSGQIVCR